MGKFVDLVGKKFERYEVIAKGKNSIKGNFQYWLCKCSCGTIKEVKGTSLTSGVTLSCGCYKRDRSYKHGGFVPEENVREHKTWESMISRCHNEKDTAYLYYGGRGIYVCERWRFSFVNFLKDMGKKPSRKHSIDRIDNDGPYSPENCRWATAKEQNRNKRDNHVVETKWGRITITELSELIGINRETLYARCRNGDEGENLTRSTDNYRAKRVDTPYGKITYEELAYIMDISPKIISARYQKGDRGDRLIRPVRGKAS